jgi:DNA-binding HxlR family transcriptional regulator
LLVFLGGVTEVTTKTRTYGHFCLLATALEQLGDRWTLLVVRDLITGPRRFTDLLERLAGITPKTLTQRLRELEDHGLVEVDRVRGRREVWYRLTAAGQELEPVLDEILYWGLRHALRPWEPGEPAHPEHLLWALRVMLERENPKVGTVRWVVRFVDDGTYVIQHADERWTVESGDADHPDVVVTTTRDAWARFLTSPPAERSANDRDLSFTGSRRAVTALLRAISVFPFGRTPR